MPMVGPQDSTRRYNLWNLGSAYIPLGYGWGLRNANPDDEGQDVGELHYIWSTVAGRTYYPAPTPVGSGYAVTMLAPTEHTHNDLNSWRTFVTGKFESFVYVRGVVRRLQVRDETESATESWPDIRDAAADRDGNSIERSQVYQGYVQNYNGGGNYLPCQVISREVYNDPTAFHEVWFLSAPATDTSQYRLARIPGSVAGVNFNDNAATVCLRDANLWLEGQAQARRYVVTFRKFVNVIP